jgi:hypothetical protein
MSRRSSFEQLATEVEIFDNDGQAITTTVWDSGACYAIVVDTSARFTSSHAGDLPSGHPVVRIIRVDGSQGTPKSVELKSLRVIGLVHKLLGEILAQGAE